MEKRAPPPTSGALRDFHPYRQHQFLEADQVKHPFEVVGQRHQTPFASDFHQPLHQKIRVAEKSFDGSEGMFTQLLPESHLFGMRLDPLEGVTN